MYIYYDILKISHENIANLELKIIVSFLQNLSNLN